MQTPMFDVAVVFGTQLDEKGVFQSFVYAEIDLAMQLYLLGIVGRVAFVGNRALFETRSLPRECDEMAAYALKKYGHSKKVTRETCLIEGDSVSIAENWLFFRRKYPGFQRILQVTIELISPRSMFLAQLVYGQHATVQCLLVPGVTAELPNEKRLQEETYCMLKHVTPGELTYARWLALCRTHYATCPLHRQ